MFLKRTVKKLTLQTLVLALCFWCLLPASSHGQDTTKMLLLDLNVQIEATQAVNDMYNFKFETAEQQFRWLKQKYGWHPLPYFLHGLSTWWKIAPDVDVETYDDTFYAYMDTSIYLAERLFKADNKNVEAAFFLAAAYAFKGRLYSERRRWRKAASVSKSALRYLSYSKDNESFSPELLFGDALYNYYSVWASENYPMLRPILLFFPKGDKAKGLEQLKEVSNNAFYTRTEAQFFLMRIMATEEKNVTEALRLAEYLHTTFPDNPYFHRYYARMLYNSGRFKKSRRLSQQILYKIDSGMVGYEANTGRYASFFLAQISQAYRQRDKAIEYYELCTQFTAVNKAFDSGYYHYALMNLATFAKEDGNLSAAKAYAQKAKKSAKRGSKVYKDAKDFLKKL